MPGDREVQGSLAYCSPWGCKKSDMAEQLNNDSNNLYLNTRCYGCIFLKTDDSKVKVYIIYDRY